MRRVAAGLTYPAIVRLRRRSPASVERAAERLRDKLRHHGGGTKAGLVHWYDTHYTAWEEATGISIRPRKG